MRTRGTIGVAFVAGLAGILLSGWPAHAAAKDEHARAAAKIVEETLQQEAREGLPNRSEPLAPALEQAPNYGPARWHSGFVYDAQRRRWLRPGGVAAAAAEDNRLAAYRRARQRSAGTVEGQAELSRWCAKHNLEDQARAHWTQVLQWKPDHEEALQQLGLRIIQGNWVADRDIAEAQSYARKAQAAAANWVPRLEKLRDRLAGRNARQREKAHEELMAIDDPDAVESIDVVFCRQASEAALPGIELLGKISSPQSASALAWHAIFSPWPPVRQAAATALRSQEKYYYVPLLLDAMLTPIESGPMAGAKAGEGKGTWETQTPSAAATPTYGPPRIRTVYRLDHRISTFSWNVNEPLKEHPYWWQSPKTPVFDRASPDRVAKKISSTVTKGSTRYTVEGREYYTIRDNRVQSRRVEAKVTADRQTLTPIGTVAEPTSAQAEAYRRQSQAALYNNMVSARNAALSSVLGEAAGERRPTSPSEWWDWWYDYNEVYVPSEKPQRALVQPDPAAPAAEGTEAQRGDCLAAGTPVPMETGATPIENVAVGDRVFCCDPQTGCLTLKPVLRITARPEGRLQKVRAGGEELRSSGGHVFWVAGRGWVKARDLGKGMQLHTFRGTVPVEGVEPGSVEKSFSLVVADFGTFFVGKAAVLTHDNTIRPPTDRIVPGLAAAKTTRAVDP